MKKMWVMTSALSLGSHPPQGNRVRKGRLSLNSTARLPRETTPPVKEIAKGTSKNANLCSHWGISRMRRRPAANLENPRPKPYHTRSANHREQVNNPKLSFF